MGFRFKIFAMFAFMAAFFYSAVLFAQAAATAVGTTSAAAITTAVQAVDPNQDFLNLLLASIGGAKGASMLAVAGIVVQLVIKFMSTTWVGQWFPQLTGAVKLVIVTGLSLAAGILALMIPPASLTLGAALVHSSTLTAFMVFGNQAYQQFLQPAKPA